MKNRKISISVIIVLVISIISLGVAFAAFSTTLNIGGTATVNSSKWEIVFEGLTTSSTLDLPSTTGTASEVTHPTIKNNSTEISSYSVSLRSPGDSVTYNFKIHNKGDYAATVSNLSISSGTNLTTDTTKQSSAAATLNAMDYKLYYTDNNALVGSGDAKDCLEPGEEENVSLRIVFSSSDATNTNVLPSEAVLLDNLGVIVSYAQSTNGSCAAEQSSSGGSGSGNSGDPFQNIDGAYYTYEGKSFIGTGVNSVIVTQISVEGAIYSSAASTVCSDDSAPSNSVCPSGTTLVFNDHPAATAASTYCTNCRLMTYDEAIAWDSAKGTKASTKRIAYNSEAAVGNWWLADPKNANAGWIVKHTGAIGYSLVTNTNNVRPVYDVPNGATMSGSGTSDSPYVISVN